MIDNRSWLRKQLKTYAHKKWKYSTFKMFGLFLIENSEKFGIIFFSLSLSFIHFICTCLRQWQREPSVKQKIAANDSNSWLCSITLSASSGKAEDIKNSFLGAPLLRTVLNNSSFGESERNRWNNLWSFVSETEFSKQRHFPFFFLYFFCYIL